MKVLLVDHEDSFVYNIAQALQATGADVVTLRATRSLRDAVRVDPDAIVLSPGPGHPSDARLTAVGRGLLRRWDWNARSLGCVSATNSSASTTEPGSEGGRSRYTGKRRASSTTGGGSSSISTPR